VEQKDNEITLFFNDGTFPIKIEGGKLIADSVPE
jgi:hypothetical protein